MIQQLKCSLCDKAPIKNPMHYNPVCRDHWWYGFLFDLSLPRPLLDKEANRLKREDRWRRSTWFAPRLMVSKGYNAVTVSLWFLGFCWSQKVILPFDVISACDGQINMDEGIKAYLKELTEKTSELKKG